MDKEKIMQTLEVALRRGDAPIGHCFATFVDKKTIKDTIDLIKYQQEIIKELEEKREEDNQLLSSRINDAVNVVEKANEKYIKCLEETVALKDEAIKNTQNEAIRLFVETLELSQTNFGTIGIYVMLNDIKATAEKIKNTPLKFFNNSEQKEVPNIFLEELKEKAYDYPTLANWYIDSVMPEDKPVWTEEHLEELLNDFYLIPKADISES